VYEEPTLERYGTFRELTQGGGTFSVDTLNGPDSTGPDGCTATSDPSAFVCRTD